MIKLLANIALATTLLAVGGAASAEDLVSENRPVEARVVKVKLDGVVELRLKQGATPSLVVSTAKGNLSKIKTTQSGDTLRIGMESGVTFFGKSPTVRAELTLPAVQELFSAGVGSSEMSGFDGEALKLMLGGAGAMKVNGRHKKVDASLSGVGNLVLDSGETESINLKMSGAGKATVTGQTKQFRVKLSGVGSLEAGELKADAVELNLSGAGSAEVHAIKSASIKASGIGSVTVRGNPPVRNTDKSGMGSVDWK